MSASNIPALLSPDYFQEILSRTFKNTSIKVRNVFVEPCGAINDGFLSTLWRVRVDYIMNSSNENDSFVVKMSTSQEIAIEKVGVNGYDVQNKEMLFFEVLAPQLNKALRRIGDCETLFPNVFSVDRCNDVIVLEDLQARNFAMADRMRGLDEAHTRLALKKLAQFHAASLMIHQKYPTAYDSFDTGMFSRKITVFNDAFQSIFEIVVDEVETWPGFEKYAKKMRSLESSFIENATRCFDIQPGEFCVLNHGDAWTNNLMFTYEGNDVNEAILIDFQFCHWGSPALDLIHLLYTSLRDDLYCQDKIDEFVQTFYYELKEVLGDLEYDLSKYPTLHQFQLQFVGKMFYAFVYTATVFPILTSNDVDNDFIAHHSRDERATNFKRRMLKTTKWQNIMKKMLPVYDRKGLLDLSPVI